MSLIVGQSARGGQYVVAMQTDGDISLVRSSLGRRIGVLRAQRGLSQRDFAIVAGISRSYLSDVELGRRNVSIDNLTKIARGLDIPLAHLFSGVDSIWYTVEHGGDSSEENDG